jgi:flavin-dependent dehydrogenase
MQAQWQMKDLQELDERLERLRREAGNIGAVVIEEQRADSANTKGNKDGEGTAKGRWTSTFNGLGLGSDKFELRVEAVRLVGPRNI